MTAQTYPMTDTMADQIPVPCLPSPQLLVDIEVEQDRIIEICAIRLGAGVEPEALCSLVSPGYRVDARRQRNRRYLGLPPIDPDDLMAAPSMRELIPDLLHLARGATVVAHNAAFERRHLLREMARYGLGWDYPYMCTLKLARKLLPAQRHAGGYSLGALAARYYISNPSPHRAAGDAMTLMWVLIAMLTERAHDPRLAAAVRSCTRGGPHRLRLSV